MRSTPFPIRLILLQSVIVSATIHAFLFYSLAITFPAKDYFKGPSFLFLGSVLGRQDFSNFANGSSKMKPQNLPADAGFNKPPSLNLTAEASQLEKPIFSNSIQDIEKKPTKTSFPIVPLPPKAKTKEKGPESNNEIPPYQPLNLQNVPVGKTAQ